MRRASLLLGAGLVLMAMAACSPAKPPPAAALNPNDPGATGRTDVVGDRSTITGDKRGTTEQKDGTP